MDCVLYRRLISNLLKSTIIRVDLRIINGRFHNYFQKNYITQNVAHSSEVPQRITSEIEPSSLYVNPICMQLDQLMYNCTNHEELLNLLVTHRGAMYLHNLITVMKLLGKYVESEDKNKYRPDCDDLYLGYNNIFQKRKEKEGSESTIDLTNYSKEEIKVIDKARSELAAHFQNPQNQEYLMVYNHDRDVRDAIIRDERYDLLLQDLYVNKNKLDVESICNIIITLDALEHRYYRLYNGLLKRLLSLDISFEDQSAPFVSNMAVLLLKTCQCYARSGFDDVPLYNKVTNELIRNNLLNLMTNTGNHELLSQIIKLYSLVKSYYFPLFSKISESVERINLTPNELSWLTIMFSSHLNYSRVHDRVMYHVAERIGRESGLFSLRQLCTCVSSFSKMRLYFGEVWRICTNRLIEAIEVSLNGYEDMELDVKSLCKTVNDIVAVENYTNQVHSLIDKASLYLEQRIDELDEESSINMAISVVSIHSTLNDRKIVCKSIYDISDNDNNNSKGTDENDGRTTSKCEREGDDDGSNPSESMDSNQGYYGDLEVHNNDNMSHLNTYLLSYIWRRIGTDVIWEREPLKVFAIWLYHMLVFPHFKRNIHKRCIIPCFRQWLLVYNTRHEIADEVSKIINSLSGKYRIYTKYDGAEEFRDLLESPVPVDMLVIDDNYGNKAINMVDSSVRNCPGRATGVDLVIKGILEHYGLEVLFIDTHLWMSMDNEARSAFIESIIVNGC